MSKFKKKQVGILPPIKKRSLPKFDLSQSVSDSVSNPTIKTMNKSPSKGIILINNPPIRELDELTSMQTPVLHGSVVNGRNSAAGMEINRSMVSPHGISSV